MTAYVLTKRERYSNDTEVYGIVLDEPTAERWRNWAEGDYIVIAEGQAIRRDEPLKSVKQIAIEQEPAPTTTEPWPGLITK